MKAPTSALVRPTTPSNGAITFCVLDVELGPVEGALKALLLALDLAEIGKRDIELGLGGGAPVDQGLLAVDFDFSKPKIGVGGADRSLDLLHHRLVGVILDPIEDVAFLHHRAFLEQDFLKEAGDAGADVDFLDGNQAPGIEQARPQVADLGGFDHDGGRRHVLALGDSGRRLHQNRRADQCQSTEKTSVFSHRPTPRLPP